MTRKTTATLSHHALHGTKGEKLCSFARELLTVGDSRGAYAYLIAAQDETKEAESPEMLRLLGNLSAQTDSLTHSAMLLEQALDAFRLSHDTHGEMLTVANLAMVLGRCGHVREAGALIRRTLIQVGTGTIELDNRILDTAATIARFQGRFDEAIEFVHRAPPQPGPLAGRMYINVALSSMCQNNYQEARHALDRAAELICVDDLMSSALLSYAAAWLMLLQHNTNEAYALCQEGLRWITPEQHPLIFYPFLATLGVLAREAGDFTSAEQQLQHVLHHFHQRQDQAGVLGAMWHLALVHLARGDEEKTGSLLRKTLAAMQHSGYGSTLLWQPHRITEMCVWGLKQQIGGLYVSWLLSTVLAQDRTERACVPPSLSVAADQLTRREQEVLKQAAKGLRDQEIAQQLCMSVRTVQNHLQRCYDKLGVRGRTKAVAQLLNNQRGAIRD